MGEEERRRRWDKREAVDALCAIAETVLITAVTLLISGFMAYLFWRSFHG